MRRRRDHPPGRRRGARLHRRRHLSAVSRAAIAAHRLTDNRHRPQRRTARWRRTAETLEQLHRRRARRLGRRDRSRSSTRPPARSSRGRRSRPPRTSIARSRPRARAFDGWSQHDARAARAGAARAGRPASRSTATEIARLEALNAGKPIEAVTSDELPVMADNLRFFAGAARCLEGRAAGEYMEGYTSFTRREAVGVIGQITPWNYPLMMAIWKIRARRSRPATRSCSSPPRRRRSRPCGWPSWRRTSCRAGVLNVVTGHGEPTGEALIEPPRRRHGLADRLGRHGQAHRAHRRRHAQARAPGARRQGAGGRLRRRQPARARWRRSPAPATTTPARTAPRPRACSPARRSTTTSSPGWPSRRRAS